MSNEAQNQETATTINKAVIPTTKSRKRGSREEDYQGYEIFLSGDLAVQYGIRLNTLNHAADEQFPAFKRPGTKFWRIPNTPELQEWLKGHQYRKGHGQGPKPRQHSINSEAVTDSNGD